MSFVPSCEICNARVPNATSLRRVRCVDCAADQARRTTARKLKQFSSDRALRRPSCSECGSTSSPRKHVRLDRNLRDEYRLLCSPCGRTLGFRPVDYTRATVASQPAPSSTTRYP